MNHKNLTVAELESIKAELNIAIQQLQDAINTGNSTNTKAALDSIREDKLHLWARFEVARLNSYMNKVEEIAAKHNRTDKINELKALNGKVQDYVTPGKAYDKGDREKVWNEIKSTSKELTVFSKELLKEERKLDKEERDRLKKEKADKIKEDKENKINSEENTVENVTQ
jgi:hypothetical protein